MSAIGHDAADAGLIADHLIDCELRGLSYGGLARAISIAERIARFGDRRRPIRIVHETPVSAQLDGGDHIGYVVAHRAAAIAVEKAICRRHRRGRRQRYLVSPACSPILEIAARAAWSAWSRRNTSPWVAPHGATEGRYGTNPIASVSPAPMTR